jgi:hypothetical protein
VEASCEPGDLEPASVHLPELERDLVGLRAGVEQDDLVERWRKEGRQSLGKREDGLGEHPRVEVDNPVERLAHRLGDPRVVVSECRADLSGGEVEHPPPVRSLDPRSLGTGDEKRGEAAGVANQEALAGVAHRRSLSRVATTAGLPLSPWSCTSRSWCFGLEPRLRRRTSRSRATVCSGRGVWR